MLASHHLSVYLLPSSSVHYWIIQGRTSSRHPHPGSTHFPIPMWAQRTPSTGRPTDRPTGGPSLSISACRLLLAASCIRRAIGTVISNELRIRMPFSMLHARNRSIPLLAASAEGKETGKECARLSMLACSHARMRASGRCCRVPSWDDRRRGCVSSRGRRGIVECGRLYRFEW